MNTSLDARGPTHEPGVTRLVDAETIAQWVRLRLDHKL
jgi:hypothetical protein